MSRAQELRQPVREIATRLKDRGFKIVDLASVGIWLIKDWDETKIHDYIQMLDKAEKDAIKAVSASREADIKAHKRKRPHPPSKAG